MKTTVLSTASILLFSGLFAGAIKAGSGTVEDDIAAFQGYFIKQNPEVALEEYKDGVNALPQYAHRRANWEILMEFPPYLTTVSATSRRPTITPTMMRPPTTSARSRAISMRACKPTARNRSGISGMARSRAWWRHSRNSSTAKKWPSRSLRMAPGSGMKRARSSTGPGADSCTSRVPTATFKALAKICGATY